MIPYKVILYSSPPVHSPQWVLHPWRSMACLHRIFSRQCLHLAKPFPIQELHLEVSPFPRVKSSSHWVTLVTQDCKIFATASASCHLQMRMTQHAGISRLLKRVLVCKWPRQNKFLLFLLFYYFITKMLLRIKCIAFDSKINKKTKFF